MNGSNHTPRIALMMDFENIVLGLPGGQKFKPKAILSRVLDLGKIVIKRAYADWSRYESQKTRLHELGFDLAEIPRRAMTGKNSADIKMVVDSMEVVISKEHIDTFALVTGDSDFTPLVAKLREHDKRVIGIGVRDSSSKLLIDSCDEFIFYDEIEDTNSQVVQEKLVHRSQQQQASAQEDGKGGGRTSQASAKLPKAGSPQEQRRRAEGLFLILEATRGLMRDHDTLWASMVKQTIIRKHPAFTENFHGYPTFSGMIEDAVALGILRADRDDKSGNWRITGIGDQALAAMNARPTPEPAKGP